MQRQCLLANELIQSGYRHPRVTLDWALKLTATLSAASPQSTEITTRGQRLLCLLTRDLRGSVAELGLNSQASS